MGEYDGIRLLVFLLSIVISFVWARSKGFNGFAWALSGGLIGWIFLAFLMPAKEPKCPPELIDKRAKRANIIGVCISILAILGFILRSV
ncbi:hypothetical protein [Mariprofundus ferrooxydans]|uniref:hypothetical protein n=1 Tax=Mariprofundus ferrooxydans TaxID=314344 RepID=UPI00128C8F64|nr:hypothetical protein [Mariprofundus ferrooxydans]